MPSEPTGPLKAWLVHENASPLAVYIGTSSDVERSLSQKRQDRFSRDYNGIMSRERFDKELPWHLHPLPLHTPTINLAIGRTADAVARVFGGGAEEVAAILRMHLLGDNDHDRG